MRNGLYTAKEAALRYGVTPSAILNWSKRGWKDDEGNLHFLPVAARTGKGVALFLLTDLNYVERETRRKRNRCHGRGKKRAEA